MNQYQFNRAKFNQQGKITDKAIPDFKVLVFDGFEQFVDELDLALLDIEEEQEIEGIHFIEIIYPLAHAGELKEGYSVAIPDMDGEWQLFDIRTIEENPVDGTVKIHAEHRFYELSTEEIKTLHFDSLKPEESIPQILQGTRWQLGLVSVTNRRTWGILDENPLSALRELENIHEGYLRFRVSISELGIDAFFVDFFDSLGGYDGLEFNLDHNLQSIDVTTDKTGIVTALYGRGEGESIDEETDETERLTFVDVEWSIANGDPIDKPLGQDWVGDEEARLQYGKPSGFGTKKHIFGVYESQAKTPERLLQETYRQLVRSNKPLVNIQASGTDMEKVPGFEHEKTRLGKTVLVNAENVEQVVTEIIKIRRNRLSHEVVDIEFGNFRPAVTDTITDIQQTTRKISSRQGIYDRAGDGPVDTDRLQGVIDAIKNQVVAGGGTVVDDGGGIWVIDTDTVEEALSAIRMVALDGQAALFLGNRESTQAEWNFRAGITTDGFRILADEIIGGTLTLGGFDNTEGVFRLLNDVGDTIILGNKEGFTLADGAKIIGDGGVLSVFQFVSSDRFLEGWGELGIRDLGGFYEKARTAITVKIPSNFQITKAEMQIQSMPVRFTDAFTNTTKWKQSRNLRIFSSPGFDGFLEYPQPGSANIEWRSSQNITSSVLGMSSWSPSITPSNDPKIQAIIGNIINHIESGQQTTLYVETTDAPTEANYNNNQALGKIIVTVEGFIKQ